MAEQIEQTVATGLDSVRVNPAMKPVLQLLWKLRQFYGTTMNYEATLRVLFMITYAVRPKMSALHPECAQNLQSLETLLARAQVMLRTLTWLNSTDNLINLPSAADLGRPLTFPVERLIAVLRNLVMLFVFSPYDLRAYGMLSGIFGDVKTGVRLNAKGARAWAFCVVLDWIRDLYLLNKLWNEPQRNRLLLRLAATACDTPVALKFGDFYPVPVPLVGLCGATASLIGLYLRFSTLNPPKEFVAQLPAAKKADE